MTATAGINSATSEAEGTAIDGGADKLQRRAASKRTAEAWRLLGAQPAPK